MSPTLTVGSRPFVFELGDVMFQRIIAACIVVGLVGGGIAAVAAAQQTSEGAMALGTINIPRAVMADGKPLAAGTYGVQLTPESAKPDVTGQLPELNRWVEFVQGQAVKGREIVSIVPADEIAALAKGPGPRAGTSSIEMLKGDEYLRIWINQGGVHYLIHLPPA